MAQNLQNFPGAYEPLTSPDGLIAVPWYRFLIALWNKTGAGFVNVANTVVLERVKVGTQLVIQALIGQTGQVLGDIQLANQPGQPAVPQVVGTSPFLFKDFADQGTLIVSGAQVEISRDAGVTWYLVTVMGGAIPLKIADQARITWYGGDLPKVTYLPDGLAVAA